MKQNRQDYHFWNSKCDMNLKYKWQININLDYNHEWIWCIESSCQRHACVDEYEFLIYPLEWLSVSVCVWFWMYRRNTRPWSNFHRSKLGLYLSVTPCPWGNPGRGLVLCPVHDWDGSTLHLNSMTHFLQRRWPLKTCLNYSLGQGSLDAATWKIARSGTRGRWEWQDGVMRNDTG